jgi:hypothetical protein
MPEVPGLPGQSQLIDPGSLATANLMSGLCKGRHQLPSEGGDVGLMTDGPQCDGGTQRRSLECRVRSHVEPGASLTSCDREVQCKQAVCLPEASIWASTRQLSPVSTPPASESAAVQFRGLPDRMSRCTAGFADDAVIAVIRRRHKSRVVRCASSMSDRRRGSKRLRHGQLTENSHIVPDRDKARFHPSQPASAQRQSICPTARANKCDLRDGARTRP